MPGGIYHVASRGNRRQDIFLAGLDRKRFLEELVDVIERCEWRCYAYSLMGNHFHLIVETLQPNISTGMQLLKGNTRSGSTGAMRAMATSSRDASSRSSSRRTGTFSSCRGTWC